MDGRSGPLRRGRRPLGDHLSVAAAAGAGDDRGRAHGRVPFAWFTADEEFGQNPGLYGYLEGERIPYVMVVPKNTTFLDSAGWTREMEA